MGLLTSKKVGGDVLSPVLDAGEQLPDGRDVTQAQVLAAGRITMQDLEGGIGLPKEGDRIATSHGLGRGGTWGDVLHFSGGFFGLEVGWTRKAGFAGSGAPDWEQLAGRPAAGTWATRLPLEGCGALR